MNNEQEFARIVKEHKSTIYTVCYMFSKDKEEVDDLFQDILINMWKGFGSFRGDSNLDTWIWRVSLNTCISAERKKKKEGEKVPLTMDIDLFKDSDEGSKQVQKLHERIHKLDVIDRALVLLWLEDISYEEIGAIVGISAKNVGVKLFRIREQLKSMSDSNE